MSRENPIQFQTEQQPLTPPPPPPQEADYDSELEKETLRLFDFPLYSDEFDSSRKDRSSKITEQSGDLCATTSAAPEENNIIFGGRFRDSGRSNSSSALKLRKKQRLSFKWRLRLFRKQRNNPYQRLPNSMYKCRRNASEKSDITTSVKKVAAQSGGFNNYRWRLLVFGSAKFPMEMELQDMKMRQNRRSSNNPSKKRNIGSWVLWRLLRTLSCGSRSCCHHGSAVVKSSRGGVLHLI